MADTLRIKRRAAGGASGAPSSLAAAELAYNEQDDTLYYGKGNSSGLATTIIPIGGPGTFALIASSVIAPQGRLTLQSATPVMTTTQSAKTTIYYSPSIGDRVPIWNGANLVVTSIGAEISALTTDTTKSPAAIGASKVNDWYVWNDAGTIRLSHGPDWTNDTTRNAAAAIPQRLNGIWVNNTSIANGPAALFGTYVGTTRSNASSQLDWILGSQAVGGGAAFLGVWNAYNRADIRTSILTSTSTWSYGASGIFRPAENSTSFRASWIAGLQDETFYAQYVVTTQAGVGGYTITGVGLDITNNFTGIFTKNNDSNMQQPTLGSNHTNALGFHFYQAMEGSGAAGTASYYGFIAGQMQSGLTFSGRM